MGRSVGWKICLFFIPENNNLNKKEIAYFFVV